MGGNELTQNFKMVHQAKSNLTERQRDELERDIERENILYLLGQDECPRKVCKALRTHFQAYMEYYRSHE